MVRFFEAEINQDQGRGERGALFLGWVDGREGGGGGYRMGRRIRVDGWDQKKEVMEIGRAHV